jgi:hypothetical protein
MQDVYGNCPPLYPIPRRQPVSPYLAKLMTAPRSNQPNSGSNTDNSNNPFSNLAPATRRLANMSVNVPPPTYFPATSIAVILGLMLITADSKYVFFTQFDTVFLIDDFGNIAGRSWREIKKAFSIITPIYIAYDADDINIYFLNYRNTRKVSLSNYVTTRFQRSYPKKI